MKCNLCNAELQKSGSFDGQQQNHEPEATKVVDTKRMPQICKYCDRSRSHHTIAGRCFMGRTSYEGGIYVRRMAETYFEQAEPAAAENDSSRCSLDGAPRIPLNREGTKFGACTLVNGKDGTGGCKDSLHDYEIEQQAPAVEPQKVVRDGCLPGCFWSNDHGESPNTWIEHVHGCPNEAGSTRPEMPPASRFKIVKINMVCFKLYLYGHFIGSLNSQAQAEKRASAISVCIEKELRMTSKSLSNLPLEQMTAHSGTINGLESVAASVQQEPLRLALENIAANYGGCHCDHTTADCCEKAGEFCPHCIAEIALKSQPAAPRTQGRELELLHGIAESLARHYMDSLPHGHADMAGYFGTPDKDFGTLDSVAKTRYAFIADSMRKADAIKNSLAQARTQPAPKCPKCKSIFINIEYNVFVADGVRPIHRATCRECEYELTYKHNIADFEEFFTALPEATNRDERQKEVAERGTPQREGE